MTQKFAPLNSLPSAPRKHDHVSMITPANVTMRAESLSRYYIKALALHQTTTHSDAVPVNIFVARRSPRKSNREVIRENQVTTICLSKSFLVYLFAAFIYAQVSCGNVNVHTLV